MLPSHLIAKTRPVADERNVVTANKVRITVLQDRLFRVERSDSNVYTDDATLSVWYRDHQPESFEAEMNEDKVIVRTKAVVLEVNRGDIFCSKVTFADGGVAFFNNAENLRGTLSTLDTNGEHLREYPQVNHYDREHIPLEPGVVSRNGVAVYDDSNTLLLGSNGLPHRREATETDLYVFAFGHDYFGAVKALYSICGSAPVIPRWALGNWWSRYWPYTQQEYVDLMDNFKDEHVPISVAVLDMDWHHVQIDRDFSITEQGLSDFEHGGTDGWTGYTWNTKLFPDHRALLTDLHERGMKVTLNLHPAEGVRWYEKYYESMARRVGIDPASKRRVPFAIENERFLTAYLEELHHPLEQEGVDFWWIDWQQGRESALSGLNPLWALNHYHYSDHRANHGEGLILSRYAGLGSHRYPVGFSGDTHMDWEFLRYMPYFTATASNAGYSWWSHDIGGHHRGERDEELYLRWLQFGVFSPINRIHNCPSEVTAKEPWTYSTGTRLIAAKWLQLRRKMVPFLYTWSLKTNTEGRPLITPMYYQWPEKNAAYTAYDQYMFGDDFLVAPIIRHSGTDGLAYTDVWLPEGNWTDLFTHVRYEGGCTVRMWRDGGSIPVLAKDGAILPLDIKMGNDCARPDSLEIYTFEGEGAFELLESVENETIKTRFTMLKGERLPVCLKIVTPANDPMSERTFKISFINTQNGLVKVFVNGREVPAKTRHNRCIQAEVTLLRGSMAEIVVFRESEDDLERIKAELLKCAIRVPQEILKKEAWWCTLKQCASIEELGIQIEKLAIPEVWKGLMQERLHRPKKTHT